MKVEKLIMKFNKTYDKEPEEDGPLTVDELRDILKDSKIKDSEFVYINSTGFNDADKPCFTVFNNGSKLYLGIN